MKKKYPRDLVGYGSKKVKVKWPGNAKLALQFVLNYEEGAENCTLHGDKTSEVFLSEIIGAKPINGRHLNIESIYNYEKITSLFNNSDTMSFIELIIDYKKLLNNGYNERFLNQSLHTMLTLPFFLFLMTSIASILTMNTLRKSDNLKFLVLGLKLIRFH